MIWLGGVGIGVSGLVPWAVQARGGNTAVSAAVPRASLAARHERAEMDPRVPREEETLWHPHGQARPRNRGQDAPETAGKMPAVQEEMAKPRCLR